MMSPRSTRVTQRLPHYPAVALLLACTACPGSLEDPARFDRTVAGTEGRVDEQGGNGGRVEENGADAGCPDVPAAVFVPKCATAGCHSATDKAQKLDLQSPDVASRLVGVSATGGGYLIDPAHTAASVIYTKLMSPPPFGARMPFGQALDDATIACVLDWVAAQPGADGGAGGR